MAAPHPPIGFGEMRFDQVLDNLRVVLALEFLAVDLKQVVEFLGAWIRDFNLIGNPPEEGFID